MPKKIGISKQSYFALKTNPIKTKKKNKEKKNYRKIKKCHFEPVNERTLVRFSSGS
jgi:hypothetical protein